MQAFPFSPGHLAHVTAKASRIPESEVRAKLAAASGHVTHFFHKEEKLTKSTTKKNQTKTPRNTPPQAIKPSIKPHATPPPLQSIPVTEPSTDS